MSKKLLEMLGGAVVIVLLLVGFQYFLESSRPPALKAWEGCKRKILANWAGAHTNQVTPLIRFTEDHFYSFGGESPPNSFDDHDSRGTAQADAAKLAISAHELIQMDQRIANECGPFPKS